jgi:methionine-rich copper-binding protein CopC
MIHVFNFSRYKIAKMSILAVIMCGLFILQTGVVLAHSQLKTASISPNAVLTGSPSILTLTFTEDTSPDQTKLQVLDSTGKVVDKGDLKVNKDTATISLTALSDGKYTVKFRTFTEDDSGVVNGEFSFTVAKSGAASAGDANAVTQTQSGGTSPAQLPSTGVGIKDSFNLLVPLQFCTAILILASAGFVINRRRNR